MKIIKAITAIAFTFSLIWILNTRIGILPPLGKFLSPATGFLKNAEPQADHTDEKLNIAGLTAEVFIQFDRSRIPHIFAANDHDVYVAQGYITARDRLWQMDLQVRTAAGTLSEVLGSKTLEQDLYYRRMAIAGSAVKSLRLMLQDSAMKKMLEAYTDGVNAYISSLSPAQYPIEFKLLDYKPAAWTPLNCVLMMKLMAKTLNNSDDFNMANAQKHFSSAALQDLFPDKAFREEPIVPRGTKWGFAPVSLPKPPDKLSMAAADINVAEKKLEGIGSNNWVVGAEKSATGYPILANDPHLNLTFPSIWYQLQLSAPGLNVYGVSIPGAPCVITGFNQRISWGLSNAEADLMDWYQVQFKDLSRNEYWYDNRWLPVRKKVEEVKVRGKKAVFDTVLYTHQGPVVYKDAAARNGYVFGSPGPAVGYALKWVGHEASEEMKTFYLLNRGNDYNDYRKALTYYFSPAQNFVFASVAKDIAIVANGKYPLRYTDQGKYLLDGSNAADDWYNWIPMEQLPAAKNPQRGYLSSANQSPADSSYPYYLSWNFGGCERAKRINYRLSRMQRITVDSMRILQNDTYSIVAEEVLDSMLIGLKNKSISTDQQQLIMMLKSWDRQFDAKALPATIFNAWWSEFYKAIWIDDCNNGYMNTSWPSRDRTIKLLLKERAAHWFDDIRTPETETCNDLLYKTFVYTADSLSKRYGKPGKNWAWGKIKQAQVLHLGNIEAFSSDVFAAGGSSTTVNAMGRNFGPSWRMVVALGPDVKGYGILPGGESGNPGSFYYDNLVDTWKAGKLNELVFLKSPADTSKEIISTLTLKK